MKSRDQDRIWRGVFAGEDLDPIRRASLEAGLSFLRKRRRRRRFWAVAGSVAPLAAVLAIVAYRGRGGAPGSGPVASASTPAAPAVKFIDDAELLAAFPDRAVALIGPPGNQQLRFLDTAPRPGD
jgi:hypothetical protein